MQTAMTQYTEDDYLDGEGPDPEQAEKDRLTDLYVKLDALGQVLSKTRSEAIEARETSGVEQEWTEDEEYYEGIDDANRREHASWSSKPMGSGGVDTSENGQMPTGSRVFPNITRPYVDAGAARTADMLLPTDDVAFAIDPTPVPDLISIADGKFPSSMMGQLKAQIPDENARNLKMQELVEQAKQTTEAARESAEKAQAIIQDWHVECQYHSHVRNVIESAAKIGTGILKGPIPGKKVHVAFKEGRLVIEEIITPISVAVDPWNFYPDAACGESIHNGSHTWERDDITARNLENLKGTPGYIDAQIDKCLEEGSFEACRITKDNELGIRNRNTKDLYEIWYMYGMVKREELETIDEILKTQRPQDAEGGDDPMEDAPQYKARVFVKITMVNNRMIQMVQSELDSEEFPYDVMVWQKRRRHWTGIGVARQVRVAQNIIKAGFRSMMDNGGQSAGPQVIVNPNYCQPQDGIYEFVPWKIWLLVKDLDADFDIDSVFRFIKTDMMQVELQNIIQLGLRLAEDSTGLPMIMQGQTNQATPTTLGGMQLQDNNASTVLRRIARLFDDRITEPHVRRYYRYLLQYHDDDSAKGEFVINAMGSSALVERDLQNQQIGQMANIVTNPIFGVDPKKWFSEYLKSNRLDVSRFEYDDVEWKKVVERLSQPPQDSSVQVAQIREEGALQREMLKKALAEFIQASKENIEERKLMVSDSQFTRDQQFRAVMSQVEQDVVAFQEQNAKGINDDNLKTRLAEVVLKLRPIYEGMKLDANALPKPPSEPAGRAPAGESYQK